MDGSCCACDEPLPGSQPRQRLFGQRGPTETRPGLDAGGGACPLSKVESSHTRPDHMPLPPRGVTHELTLGKLSESPSSAPGFQSKATTQLPPTGGTTLLAPGILLLWILTKEAAASHVDRLNSSNTAPLFTTTLFRGTLAANSPSMACATLSGSEDHLLILCIRDALHRAGELRGRSFSCPAILRSDASDEREPCTTTMTRTKLARPLLNLRPTL